MTTGGRQDDLDQLTEKIIGSAYTVSNALGCGFLEKVYENALAIELRKAGLRIAQQPSVQVRYDGQVVGDFTADLVVEDRVLLELKAVDRLDALAMAQCLNYLRATELDLCLLLNFGKPKVEVKRIIF